MRTSSPFNIRRGAKLLPPRIAVAIMAALAVAIVLTTRRAPSIQQTIGFDFGQHTNLDWSGPKIGERLDLRCLAGRAGERLPDAVSGEFFMLATIDPDCAASWEARDQMRDVRNHIAPAGVPYLLVSATTSRPPEDFFKYAESLAADAPAFMWASKGASPPESLATMVVPSHILVSRDGTIIRTWPGTSQSKRVRFQMVNQIVADTIEVAGSRQ